MSDSRSDEESVLSAASLAQSDRSRDFSPNFSLKPSNIKITEDLKMSDSRSDEESVLSAASLAQSDRSRDFSPNFSLKPSNINHQTASSHQQKQETLKVFEAKAMGFVKKVLTTHQKVLLEKHQEIFGEDEQEEEVVDQLLEVDDDTNEAALKISLHILKTMKKEQHARALAQSHYGELAMYQRKLKYFLKKKHESLIEVINTERCPMPLRKIYTRLYLIEGVSGGVNNEHEVRQIETAFNRPKSSETLIKCEDIFKLLPEQRRPIRTVLTKGIAGIGKTVLAQKFMLDWSEGKTNQHIQLLFSLPFRELNLLRNGRSSLMELLYNFSPGLKESGIKDLKMYKVLFVLDGLDECRLQLDFVSNERCSEATRSASVDVLLTNLIEGNLLPNAILWITSRPAAAGVVPPQHVDRVTEIRGFDNPQKEQYFLKKIEDENLARRVVAHIKTARSLYIMCHVPVFCWMSSIVLGKMFAEAAGGKMPKTLTQMYIHFLIHQTTRKYVKYSEEQQLDSRGNNKVIVSLGKLAFQQLEKGNLIFYEKDLEECGIDVKEASVYSGLCTEVFREESWMQQKVFCFVHLSVQEFLAALYVHVVYKVDGINLMMEKPGRTSGTEPASKLHEAAVDKTLRSNNGHLDLFLRFLLGLSVKSSQALLKALKIKVETCDSQSHEETIEYIKKKINESPPPEKSVNLFHCLNELNDRSMVEEVQSHLDSDRDLAMDQYSAAQWAALVFVLLTSPEKLEEIHLKKYSRTEDGLVWLLPAIKASTSAMLNDCNLTTDSCRMLSSTLSSSCNELKHLNLSDNNLEDSAIELLCSGLQSQHCKLKTLRLNRCILTWRCCNKLAAVLSFNPSHLQEMDLSNNDIEDSGVEFLCTGLGNRSCKLETLRLSFCSITEKGCVFLASAVKSNPSHLKELDLSYNPLGDTGVMLIQNALEEGRCELIKLRVDHRAGHWFKSGLKEYSFDLTLDPNTIHKRLVLSDDNRKVSWYQEEQPYPDHPHRFDHWAQVLLQGALKGRHYWEVEWEGNWAGIGVTYGSICRKGPDYESVIGYNKVSWSLHCSLHGYRAYHDIQSIVVQVPLAGCRRLAVYLDWESGILSFYRVSSKRSLAHLHTFVTTFTEPLYPVFRVWGKGSSVRLCSVR